MNMNVNGQHTMIFLEKYCHQLKWCLLKGNDSKSFLLETVSSYFPYHILKQAYLVTILRVCLCYGPSSKLPWLLRGHNIFYAEINIVI